MKFVLLLYLFSILNIYSEKTIEVSPTGEFKNLNTSEIIFVKKEIYLLTNLL